MPTLGPFSVAVIADRPAGTYKTGQRQIPANTYTAINFGLIFDAGQADAQFKQGDVIFGRVELDRGDGAGWVWLVEAEWHGGHEPPADPEKGTTGGYWVAAHNVTVPAGTVARAGCRVVPGTPGGTVRFGVTVTAET